MTAMTPSILQPYSAYKSSGVERVGDVPEHWGVRRLKYWVGMNHHVLPESTAPEFRFRYLDISSVGTGTLLERPREMPFAKSPSRARRIVQEGDTIVSTVRTYLKAVLFIEGVDDDLVCSTGFAVLTPKHGTSPKFVSYFVQCNSFTDWVTANSTGTAYPAISESQLGSFHIGIPPPSEQAAIVRYLDYVDRRIRHHVTAKERLIGLLEEEKQAVINRAVTCGLDPNVPLKPSGVEWLGDVPEHWEVIRNGQLFVQRNETGFPELPILEVSLRTGVRLRDVRDSHRKQIMSVRSEYKRAVKGDVVYNMMRMWQGAVGVVPTDGLVSPAYVVAKPRRGTEPRYFSALFRTTAYMVEVDKYSRGIVKDRNRLYWQDFKQMPTPYPPLEEQVLISDAIARSMEAVNNDVN